MSHKNAPLRKANPKASGGSKTHKDTKGAPHSASKKTRKVSTNQASIDTFKNSRIHTAFTCPHKEDNLYDPYFELLDKCHRTISTSQQATRSNQAPHTTKHK